MNVGWVKLSLRSLVDWMEKPTMPPPSETPKITLYRILGRIPAHVSRRNHFGRRGKPGKALDVREQIAPERISTFADAYQTN